MRILNKSTQNKHSAGMSALGQAPSVRSKMPHSREKSGILDSRANSSTFISFHKKNAQGKTSKRGFTLMELMVYCGLIGIIVMVAGQAYSDSVKFRIRSEAMVKSSSEANAAAVLLQEDLSQMGAKASFEDGSAYNLDSAVYYDLANGDTASYDLHKNQGGIGLDSISFKRLVYDNSGKAEFLQQISWYAQNKKLYRKCETLHVFSEGSAPADCGSSESPTPAVLIAKDSVTKFSLIPGRRMQDGNFCTPTDLAHGCYSEASAFTFVSTNQSGTWPLTIRKIDGINAVRINGFYNNAGATTVYPSQLYFINNPVSGEAWNECSQFTFKQDTVYAISFKLNVPNDGAVNYMRNFQAEIDHIGVGFRTRSGALIQNMQDFLVYPAQQDEAEDSYRYFEFAFREEVTNACLTLTFSFYSPHAAEGYLEFSKLNIFPRDSKQYDFITPGDDKRKHKAFNLEFNVNNRGEVTQIERIIPTPNNGV